HHTKRAFFDQVPGKAPNGNAPFLYYDERFHYCYSKSKIWEQWIPAILDLITLSVLFHIR
ncbi:hypothetical protein, partial [Geobacillus stearothermophilus]